MSNEDLFKQLEEGFKKVESEGVKNLSEESVENLLNRLHELDDFLKSINQVLSPRTQEARDAHSERNAIQVVLHEKGII